MNLAELLKKNKKIHYLLKALKHIGDKQYVDFYLDMESNPRLLIFDKKGERNKDKAFYVIKENGKGWGYFAEFRALLCKLLYAERFGFCPYIYWGKDFLYFDESMQQDNAFEYFFKQPKGFDLEEINRSYMVAESKSADAVLIEREYKEEENYGITEQFLEIMAGIYKKYIFFNEQTKEKLKKDFQNVQGNGKVLGVHFRGTDYRKEYDIHPTFIRIEEEIEAVRKVFEKGGYDKIFVATDEQKAIEIFEEEFGKEKICYYQDVQRGDAQTSVAFSESNRQHHKYLLGYEVIRDMWTLSRCNGLVAGVSQVSIFARIIKKSRDEKYDSLEIINKGINHNNNKFEYKK